MEAITPQSDELKAALVAKPLFDELIECWKQVKGKEVEVEWGPAHRKTVTFFEPTIYELDPHPDPLTVADE